MEGKTFIPMGKSLAEFIVLLMYIFAANIVVDIGLVTMQEVIMIAVFILLAKSTVKGYNGKEEAE